MPDEGNDSGWAKPPVRREHPINGVSITKRDVCAPADGAPGIKTARVQ